MEIDPTKAKPAKAQRFQVLRDGKIKTVWVPRVNFPGVRPVWVEKNGRPAEFDTEQEANEYAKATAAEWQQEAQP